MKLIRTVVLWFLIKRSYCLDQDQDHKFPEHFKFGVGSSAYQIEGAWNESDKSENIWDKILHASPNMTRDERNGDISCDSYNLWKRDIEMVEELGVDMYRFSISWSRLLPSGFPNKISKDGRQYYDNLINGLLEKGIQPLVTLYHFDLPQPIQDLGGWANPHIVTWFGDYARAVYTEYGDRVKTWITINAPLLVCDGSYSNKMAPYLDDMKIGMYLCNKHVLLAHATAYRIYDEDFKHMHQGKVSLSNIFFWFEPESPADEDVTILMFQMWEGRFAHPIFSEYGGWPSALEKVLNANGRKEGYPYPSLPPLTREEADFIKGTYDFYALNHYTTRLVRKVMPGFAGTWPYYGSEEIGASMVSDPAWSTAAPSWFSIHPEGLRKQLNWINKTYGVNDIMITENGLPLVSKNIRDNKRLAYMRSHLEQILLAIQDGINVIGYTAWSLMDSFEWTSGYLVNHGLYSVDFNSPQKTRTPRESARYFSSVTRTRSIHSPLRGLNYV